MSGASGGHPDPVLTTITEPRSPAAPVVLVTGATGGIGGASAHAWARCGADLVLVARSPGALADLARDLARDHPSVATVTVVADVLDGDAVEVAFTAARERFGRVDVVVHSAAVVAYGALVDVPDHAWDRVVDVGVRGTANVLRTALRTWRDTAPRPQDARGTVVVVGSILGEVTTPFMSSYVTSKWAVHGLVRTVQQELRAVPGVRLELVVPGSVRTRIYDLAGSWAGRDGRLPPPVVSPERVADAVVRAGTRGRGGRTSVGPANPLMRLGFAATPRLYDRLVVPLMRVAGLRRARSAPHEGNVFVPSEQTAE